MLIWPQLHIVDHSMLVSSQPTAPTMDGWQFESHLLTYPRPQNGPTRSPLPNPGQLGEYMWPSVAVLGTVGLPPPLLR